MSNWIPCAGNTGIKGTVVKSVFVNSTNCGTLVAWQDQSNPLSQYSGPSNIGKNPLTFEFSAQIVVDEQDVELCAGQQVTFSVAAGEFGNFATNVSLL
jgi:hypothetical protein